MVGCFTWNDYGKYKFINLTNLIIMKTNSFKCPHCNKYTRHITISMREYFASEGAPQAVQFLFGSVNDYLGTAKVGELLTGRNHWKCTECGLYTLRSSDGTIKWKGSHSK